MRTRDGRARSGAGIPTRCCCGMRWTRSARYGLVVSHLDAVEGAGLKWCSGYRDAQGSRWSALPIGHAPDLEHQRALTQRLSGVQPLYEGAAIAEPHEWIERVEALSGLAVRYGGFGPTRGTVRALRPFEHP